MTCEWEYATDLYFTIEEKLKCLKYLVFIGEKNGLQLLHFNNQRNHFSKHE